MSEELKNSLWVEKYRPRKIEDLRLPEEYMNDFKSFIKNKNLPHVLLYGPPGGGKCVDGDEIIEVYIEIDE